LEKTWQIREAALKE
jgi:colicin import membrane protein